MSENPEMDSLLSAIELTVWRVNHIAERLPLCVGIDVRTTHRAMNIASRLLGVDYMVGRMVCSTLLVGDHSMAIRRAGEPDYRLVGFVYEAEPVGYPNVYKIGFSRMPDVRIKSLSVRLGHPLNLLRTWPGTMLDELVEHCRLRDRRLFGEWFRRGVVS